MGGRWAFGLVLIGKGFAACQLLIIPATCCLLTVKTIRFSTWYNRGETRGSMLHRRPRRERLALSCRRIYSHSRRGRADVVLWVSIRCPCLVRIRDQSRSWYAAPVCEVDERPNAGPSCLMFPSLALPCIAKSWGCVQSDAELTEKAEAR